MTQQMLSEIRCPSCKISISGFEDLTARGKLPEPGNLCVCPVCFTLSKFAEPGSEEKLILLQGDELIAFQESHPAVWANIQHYKSLL